MDPFVQIMVSLVAALKEGVASLAVEKVFGFPKSSSIHADGFSTPHTPLPPIATAWAAGELSEAVTFPSTGSEWEAGTSPAILHAITLATASGACWGTFRMVIPFLSSESRALEGVAKSHALVMGVAIGILSSPSLGH